jgi:hypothetical protein
MSLILRGPFLLGMSFNKKRLSYNQVGKPFFINQLCKKDLYRGGDLFQIHSTKLKNSRPIQVKRKHNQIEIKISYKLLASSTMASYGL